MYPIITALSFAGGVWFCVFMIWKVGLVEIRNGGFLTKLAYTTATLLYFGTGLVFVLNIYVQLRMLTFG